MGTDGILIPSNKLLHVENVNASTAFMPSQLLASLPFWQSTVKLNNHCIK